MKKEIWKDAIVWYKGEKLDYKGQYQVSNLGEVRSVRRVRFISDKRGRKYSRTLKGKTLKQVNMNGYRYVNLTDGEMKTFYVHLIVLSTFVGKRPEKMECCHYDGIRHHNDLENLRWDTHSNNINDEIRLQGKLPWQKINDEEIFKIKTKLCSGINPKEIAKIHDVRYAIVTRIKNDSCECYKNVPWPDLPKNFWKKPDYFKQGLKANNSKLSTYNIVSIKKLIKENKLSGCAIAKLYNISASNITRIKSGERYRNVV